MIDSISRSPDRAERELQAARDIAHAFLNATRPADVYQLAIERVTPLVGAAFACVFLRAGTEDLLEVVATHNWPDPFTEYLSMMRVRIGNGPTGQAVAENRVIEVYDIFADTSLEDWWDSARELGFASSTSLPLVFQGEPIGAVTFYFREPEALSEADRSLLCLVADQLAAAAEKTHLIEDLQRANHRLRAQNIELEARFREAEEARRLKSEFLANVSHELRTPLTAVLGYTYLLREGLSGELQNDQAVAVEKIETAATNLMRLINDLLDITHLNLGRTTVEFETCDAVVLTRAALSTLPELPVVELRTELPDPPVSVYTDPVHALRILNNLLSNAVKFTPEGSVTLRLRQVAQITQDERALSPAVMWEVQDTGIGISEEDHERIFDEFRQVDGSATRRYGGTGLGLALSRGLAHRLGGEITVESAVGTGATFRLTLPAEPAALPERAAQTESRTSEGPTE